MKFKYLWFVVGVLILLGAIAACIIYAITGKPSANTAAESIGGMGLLWLMGTIFFGVGREED